MQSEKLYSLYVNETKHELKIKKMSDKAINIKIARDLCKDTSEVKYFNGSYYYCSDRKELKTFARTLKQKWMNKLLGELEKIKNIKI